MAKCRETQPLSDSWSIGKTVKFMIGVEEEEWVLWTCYQRDLCENVNGDCSAVDKGQPMDGNTYTNIQRGDMSAWFKNNRKLIIIEWVDNCGVRDKSTSISLQSLSPMHLFIVRCLANNINIVGHCRIICNCSGTNLSDWLLGRQQCTRKYRRNIIYLYELLWRGDTRWVDRWMDVANWGAGLCQFRYG